MFSLLYQCHTNNYFSQCTAAAVAATTTATSTSIAAAAAATTTAATATANSKEMAVKVARQMAKVRGVAPSRVCPTVPEDQRRH